MRDWPGSAEPRRESEPPARLTVDSRTSERQSYLFVTKLNADGTAGWTFSGEIPGTVVSTATSFVVTGSNGNYDSDMDPGPGIDTVGGATLYLSRFNF